MQPILFGQFKPNEQYIRYSKAGLFGPKQPIGVTLKGHSTDSKPSALTIGIQVDTFAKEGGRAFKVIARQTDSSRPYIEQYQTGSTRPKDPHINRVDPINYSEADTFTAIDSAVKLHNQYFKPPSDDPPNNGTGSPLGSFLGSLLNPQVSPEFA